MLGSGISGFAVRISVCLTSLTPNTLNSWVLWHHVRYNISAVNPSKYSFHTQWNTYEVLQCISVFLGREHICSVLTFLCPAIISSRRMARKMVCTLKLGWTKQRAAAIILAVRGPLMPIVLKYSSMFGVSLNGTGRLASRSPVSHTMEYTHSHLHQFYQCIVTFLWWLMD